MKRIIIFLLILSLCSKLCKAQDYVPFPRSDAKWKEATQTVSGPGGTSGENYHFELIGDTLIQGMLCSKLYKTINGIEYKYWGSIREDSSKHVYFIPEETEVFHLLYDFNIAVGDTLQYYGEDPDYFYGGTLGNYYVSKIDTILLLDDIPRRRYEISISENPQGFDRYEIIEGIGSIHGLLNNKGNTGGYSAWLWCFRLDGNPIYSKSEGACISSNINNGFHNNQICSYPNPCGDLLSISGVNLNYCNIQLLNLDGRIIINKVVSHGTELTKLNLVNINPGVYILVIEQNNGIVYQGKIVKL